MNHYEMLCILDPALGTEGKPAPGQVVEEEIAKIGGEISSSREMGRRRLAYQIGEFTDGCYQLVYFAAEPDSLKPLRESLRLNPSVVRVLILKTKPPVSLDAGGDPLESSIDSSASEPAPAAPAPESAPARPPGEEPAPAAPVPEPVPTQPDGEESPAPAEAGSEKEDRTQ